MTKQNKEISILLISGWDSFFGGNLLATTFLTSSRLFYLNLDKKYKIKTINKPISPLWTIQQLFWDVFDQ